VDPVLYQTKMSNMDRRNGLLLWKELHNASSYSQWKGSECLNENGEYAVDGGGRFAHGVQEGQAEAGTCPRLTRVQHRSPVFSCFQQGACLKTAERPTATQPLLYHTAAHLPRLYRQHKI